MKKKYTSIIQQQIKNKEYTKYHIINGQKIVRRIEPNMQTTNKNIEDRIRPWVVYKRFIPSHKCYYFRL